MIEGMNLDSIHYDDKRIKTALEIAKRTNYYGFKNTWYDYIQLYTDKNFSIMLTDGYIREDKNCQGIPVRFWYAVLQDLGYKVSWCLLDNREPIIKLQDF